jgi:hypothetical protein
MIQNNVKHVPHERPHFLFGPPTIDLGEELLNLADWF